MKNQTVDAKPSFFQLRHAENEYLMGQHVSQLFLGNLILESYKGDFLIFQTQNGNIYGIGENGSLNPGWMMTDLAGSMLYVFGKHELNGLRIEIGKPFVCCHGRLAIPRVKKIEVVRRNTTFEFSPYLAEGGELYKAFLYGVRMNKEHVLNTTGRSLLAALNKEIC